MDNISHIKTNFSPMEPGIQQHIYNVQKVDKVLEKENHGQSGLVLIRLITQSRSS